MSASEVSQSVGWRKQLNRLFSCFRFSSLHGEYGTVNVGMQLRLESTRHVFQVGFHQHTKPCWRIAALRSGGSERILGLNLSPAGKKTVASGSTHHGPGVEKCVVRHIRTTSDSRALSPVK